MIQCSCRSASGAAAADGRSEAGAWVEHADGEVELRRHVEQQRRHITHCYQEERRHFSRANTLMQQLQDMQRDH